MDNLAIVHRLTLLFIRLENYYVLSLGSFLTLGHDELNTLAFFQIAKTITDNGAEMDKHIFATFALDEAVAFAAVEPFYGSCNFFGHDLELLSSVIAE
jgi:hypothetical protein